ncbi:hypothetical protein [Clostridium niameyense]|uniref:hypothetical protein n=1 Tax=Clostridium niameyense TaxID=1622073 RepID=UPI00067EE642|nr:hypothetical protein [Clostridium niameyense]
MNNECASELRVGEERRDASDKIRGFLFQDLIAIKVMLSLDNSYSCYIEWVEDIFLENEDEIILIQVKYYPKTSVDFHEILSNMYYQFLKFQLINSDKNFKTYCYHHSETNYDEDVCKTNLINVCTENNNISEIDKRIIFEELKKSKNQDSRKELLFKKVSSAELINRLDFKSNKKSSINEFREEVAQELFDLFKCDDVVKTLSDDEARELLMSLAINYIQKKYYSNSEDCQERRIKKQNLLKHLSNVISYDEVKGISLIKSVFFNCADNIFAEILESEVDAEVIKKYEKIYISTKKYFDDILSDKLSRFKLLNTVNIKKKYKDLNYRIYQGLNLRQERENYLTNMDNIEIYIKYLWKIIFNTESNFDDIQIGNYIIENKDCFLLRCKLDFKSPILLSSEVHRSSEFTEVSNIFSRVKEMEYRPSKWYLGTIKYKGIFDYSYGINRIKENRADMGYELDDLEEEKFIIECMKCLKCDICSGEMSMDDNLQDNLFSVNCRDEV